MFKGVKTSCALIGQKIRFLLWIFGQNIHTCSETCCSIARSSYSSLDDNLRCRTCHVWNIHKKSPLTFRIVIRNTIQHYINACSCTSSNSETSVTHSVSSIRSCNYRHLIFEQNRQILT